MAWHEKKDKRTGKAPVHQIVSRKTKLKNTLRQPMKQSKKKDDISKLNLVKITEQGVTFETGVPVEFRYLRNTVRSPKSADKERFGQNLEPSGKYMTLSKEGAWIPEGWETGAMRFQNPLVIEWGTTSGDPKGWKYRLSTFFGGKTGKRLSRTLLSAGYDGIVTVNSESRAASEIIALQV